MGRWKRKIQEERVFLFGVFRDVLFYPSCKIRETVFHIEIISLDASPVIAEFFSCLDWFFLHEVGRSFST